MFTIQCVLVTILAAASVLVHSTSPTAVPTTAIDYITTTEEAASSTTSSRTDSSELTTTAATDDDNATESTTSSTATMTEPEITLGKTNATSSSNHFVFTSTWIIVFAVGGFTVLTALPLVIIMILIVALGCMCKKHKRLKKRFAMPLDTITSSNRTTTEMTTVTNNDYAVRNILILDGIDTGNNVAYARTSTISESRDIMQNTMMIPNTEEAGGGGCNYKRHSTMMMTPGGDSVAYASMSMVVQGTAAAAGDAAASDDKMAMQDDIEEDEGDSDYVINDMYDCIDT
jgi:hypothetical protein